MRKSIQGQGLFRQSKIKETVSLESIVPKNLSGQRIDIVLKKIFPGYSRNKLQYWIQTHRVTLNGKDISNKKMKVYNKDLIYLEPKEKLFIQCNPQFIQLRILHEDNDLIIINKPTNLVMHPAPGNWDRTLQNGLLYYDASLANLPRSGIIHRLDKDTSGILVIARSQYAYMQLVTMLKKREIDREYYAIVNGVMMNGGIIKAPIGRHPRYRTRMAVIKNGKLSRTDYNVLEHFKKHTFLHVKLHSGRTHQIRVHMAHIHYPIVGDAIYGKKNISNGISKEIEAMLNSFPHQALHAFRLSLRHPRYGTMMVWEAEMPDDMQKLLQAIRSYS